MPHTFAADYCSTGNPKCPVVSSIDVVCSGSTFKGITIHWNKISGATQYNVVYWHDNHIYQKKTSSTSLTIPPGGTDVSNGATDPGIKNGESGGAKVTVWSPSFSNYGAPAKSFKASCQAPSSAPSPSVPPSSDETKISLVLGLPGVGFDGSAPQHTTRPVTVELYAPNVQSPGGAGTSPIKTATGTVTYDNRTDNNSGYFVSNTPISFSNLSSGKYQILVKMPRYLYKLAINPASTSTQDQYIFTLNANTTNDIAPLILSAGDVAVTSGQLNHLNIFDYNVFLSCIGGNSSCPVATAGPDGTNLTDLNDDGKVDIIDMNIWLRSLNALNTANALGCDSADCQGD